MSARTVVRLAAALATTVTAVALAVACTSDEAVPSPAELRDRVEVALRGDSDQVLHMRTVPLGPEPSPQMESWTDWGGNAWRLDFTGDSGSRVVLTLGDRQYSNLPALDTRAFPAGSEGVRGVLAQFGLAAPERPEGDARVERIEVDDSPAWRMEQDARFLSEDGPAGGYCMSVRQEIDVATHRPLAFWTKACDEAEYQDRRGSRFEVVELLDRNSLPDGFFDPEAVRLELIERDLEALRAGPVPALWLGEEAGGLRLRRIVQWHNGPGGPEAAIEYSAGAKAREPSAELHLAAAHTPPRLACDPPPEGAPAPPQRARPATDEDPPEPSLEEVSTALGPAEHCFVPAAFSELRLYLSDTAVVINSRLPLAELVALAERLRTVDAGDRGDTE